MNQIEIMNWARERLTSLPVALVIYQATKRMSKDKGSHLLAMEHLYSNPTEAEFSLLTKMAFLLPEARGLSHMYWGDTMITATQREIEYV